MIARASLEYRALVLAPTGKDAALIITALRRADIDAERCADGIELAQKLREGAGAVVLAEEGIVKPAARLALQRVIDEQPSWSDLPVLLLSKVGPFSTHAAGAIGSLGNVTLLERPTQIATLVSAVLTALRTRERQYLMRAADERKDAFLATLAHELRNPLAPLSNALEILKRQGLAAPQRDWALGVIQRQSVQMTRLIDDLLDVARITQGKVSLQRQVIEVSDVIRNAAEISEPLIQRMQHTLITQIPDESIAIYVDPLRLSQCVSNLLNNAAKYTPGGGTIRLSVRVDETHLELEVSDTGIGIPPQAIPKLFDIFAQVDRSRPQAQGGLGIGLSIVKAFVEMHGGTVRAASEGEGRGSTFTLRIPREPGNAEARMAAPASVPARNLEGARLLVVDDNVDSADSLSDLLSACGHQVQRAYSGLSALEAAVRAKPDVAILDIGLPDIDGLELARRLRANPQTANIVLVALSGWGQATDRENAREAGFEHHLIKPADLSQILAIISRSIERSTS